MLLSSYFPPRTGGLLRWLLFCWSAATLILPDYSSRIQAQAQTVVVDPFANVSTPLRESMRNAHQGVSINIQVLEWMADYMKTKIANYEALTGVTINPILTTQATWFDDIEEDINGAGFIDLMPSLATGSLLSWRRVAYWMLPRRWEMPSV